MDPTTKAVTPQQSNQPTAVESVGEAGQAELYSQSTRQDTTAVKFWALRAANGLARRRKPGAFRHPIRFDFRERLLPSVSFWLLAFGFLGDPEFGV
jgi:hypothetical protein